MNQIEPRRQVIKVAALCFAVYAAYNVFIIVRDGSDLPPEGIPLSIIVAVLFAVIAGFSWTAGLPVKDFKVLVVRRNTYMVALPMIFALKLRMITGVIRYLNFSRPHTILYGASYFLTLAGLLILFLFYALVVRNLELYPKASFYLPLAAMILFVCSLILEIILFFAYGICLEANVLRTVVIRPVFYLGFIALSAFFLFPPPLPK